MPISGAKSEWRISINRSRIHLGTVVDQYHSALLEAELRDFVQRCPSVDIHAIDKCAPMNQCQNSFRTAAFRGVMKWRSAKLVDATDVNSQMNEGNNTVNISCLCSVMKTVSLPRIEGVNIEALRNDVSQGIYLALIRNIP